MMPQRYCSASSLLFTDLIMSSFRVVSGRVQAILVFASVASAICYYPNGSATVSDVACLAGDQPSWFVTHTLIPSTRLPTSCASHMHWKTNIILSAGAVAKSLSVCQIECAWVPTMCRAMQTAIGEEPVLTRHGALQIVLASALITLVRSRA